VALPTSSHRMFANQLNLFMGAIEDFFYPRGV
jgi:hypothetical protein